MRSNRPGVVVLLFATCVVVAWLSRSPAAQAPAACPSESSLFHPCPLAPAARYLPVRTPDGKPNLQGFWRGPASGTENIEEHPKTDDDDGGKSLIVDPPDGKIPYQPWAKALQQENRSTYVEPNVPCFPSGVPRSMYVPTQVEFLQSPDHVLILFERAHTYRIIPTTSRSHAGSRIGMWMGDSRGRWEGNTLVVDVTNLNAKTWFDQAGNFHSPAARMVERFTPIDQDTIHYQVTIDDPSVYTRAWTMAFPLQRNKQRGMYLLEEACHEGERNTDPLIRAGQKIYPGVTPKP